MPIRADLRHFYRTPEFREQRKRVVERACNRCEECLKPNGENVYTLSGKTLLPHGLEVPFMFWTQDAKTSIGKGCLWHNRFGKPAAFVDTRFPRPVRVVCTMAHLDHNPANNADENVKFLCQWCHLNYDRLHHKETRGARKDAARPLLEGARQ
jgi:hypothetical protein